MAALNKIAGVVLAGGGSRRMGGRDKAGLELDGRPLVAHVVSRLQGQVSALAINTNNAGFALPKIDLPLLPDLISGSLGPLVGVLTAMRWAAEQGATHVLTAPVDTPYLPLDLTRRLAAAARAGPVIARSNGWDHPVIGLWPVSLSATLEVDILQGQRRIGQWAKAQGGVAVAFETRRGHDPFFNVNTPEDLAELSQTTRLPGPAT